MALFEKTLFRWFDKHSHQWIQIAKQRVERSHWQKPWILIRGQKGSIGYRTTEFDDLLELFSSLYEHEVSTLAEAEKKEPIALLASMFSDIELDGS